MKEGNGVLAISCSGRCLRGFACCSSQVNSGGKSCIMPSRFSRGVSFSCDLRGKQCGMSLRYHGFASRGLCSGFDLRGTNETFCNGLHIYFNGWEVKGEDLWLVKFGVG